jgi:hypothetical protein
MACRRSAVRSRLAPPILSIGLGLFLALPLAGGDASAQGACIRQGATLSGTVREVRRRHPNGTPIRVFQIDLGRRACIEGAGMDGGRLSFRRVHVAPADSATEQRLRSALGRQVAVRGREIIEAHTAWHIGDAVMLDAVIAP